MGGLIAADYTIKNPDQVKAIVMVSPPFLKPQDIRKLPDKFYLKTFTGLKNHNSNPLIITFGSFISRLTSFESRSLKTKAFKDCMENIILNNDNWHSALQLKIPTFIIHGRLDPLVSSSNLRNLAAKNHHISLTKAVAGHDITGAKRRKVISAIKQTITKTTVFE
jgi:pimeloyl-ACP methyl ester carboxylesterase